jgi:hypothetical protein
MRLLWLSIHIYIQSFKVHRAQRTHSISFLLLLVLFFFGLLSLLFLSFPVHLVHIGALAGLEP